MTTTTTGDGELVAAPDGLAIRFERRLTASPERVWRAVTEPDEMTAWFPCRVDGERRAGATVRFVFADDDSPPEEGTVLAWSPPASWSFDWGGHVVEISVAPDGAGTLLTFTQSLPDRSGAARQGAGWHTCLDALDAHVAGAAPDAGDWQPRYTDYLRRMGPSPASVTQRPTLRWERTHFAPAARVWRAITDASEWSAWMQHDIRIESLRVGGTIHFDFGPEHGTMTSVIVGLEEGRRFAYTFGEASITEWTVEPADHGCRYTLTHHGADADSATGWHTHLATLDMYAASGQVVAQDPSLFADLYADL